MTGIITAKCGGTSVANADRFRGLEKIVLADNRRKRIVLSAPGKDANREYKVTDLLYNLHFMTHPEQDDMGYEYSKIDFSPSKLLTEVIGIYRQISYDLGMNSDLVSQFKNELVTLVEKPETTVDETVSRGENFNARLGAQYLGAKFVDSCDLIYIPNNDSDGDNDETMKMIASNLQSDELVVIPGFYGTSSLVDRKIKTFSRGGSDLVGALIAAGTNSLFYENWTDQPGMRCCNPTLFPEHEMDSIKIIDRMTYKECRELTYMGFGVFHDEAMGPVMKRSIPINIKNSFNPNLEGTWISDDYNHEQKIRGIAGINGFCSVDVEKFLMNKEKGFGRRLLSIISGFDWNYEHSPSGIDSMSVVMQQEQINNREGCLMNSISHNLKSDSVKIKSNIALIAVVGEGMKEQVGTAAKIFTCIANEGISVKIINQGTSERNIIIGVDSADYKPTIRALYRELF